jgi:hypothetical protein
LVAPPPQAWALTCRELRFWLGRLALLPAALHALPAIMLFRSTTVNKNKEAVRPVRRTGMVMMSLDPRGVVAVWAVAAVCQAVCFYSPPGSRMNAAQVR